MNNGDEMAYNEAGLTKREAFAMAAMPAIQADNPDVSSAAEVLGIKGSDYIPAYHWDKYVAVRAVQQADELLAALENNDA